MDDLSTEKASGAQRTTQNPQVGTQSSNLTGGSSDVQPGTPVRALESNGNDESSVQLQMQQVPSTRISSVSQASTAPVEMNNAAGAGLGALSVLLFITAVVLFVSTFKSSKNTTD